MEELYYTSPELEDLVTAAVFPTQEQVALEFLLPIWASVKPEVKKKYGADTWSYFENMIKSAACQPTIAKFLDKLKRLIQIDWYPAQQQMVIDFIKRCPNEGKQALKFMRQECAYLILLLRDANTQRKETDKAKKATQDIPNLFTFES